MTYQTSNLTSFISSSYSLYPAALLRLGQIEYQLQPKVHILICMTELKHACHCVYGGYIGTVGAGVTTDIIKKYVETQGTKEEKEGCKQMKLLDFK
jgi:hypothetical protein